MQTIGILILLAGMATFFSSGLKPGEPLGLAIFALAMAGFTSFGLLSRVAALDRQVDMLTITALPLAIGGGLLLVVASRFFPDLVPDSIPGSN